MKLVYRERGTSGTQLDMMSGELRCKSRGFRSIPHWGHGLWNRSFYGKNHSDNWRRA
jgi:hypothetical protein